MSILASSNVEPSRTTPLTSGLLDGLDPHLGWCRLPDFLHHIPRNTSKEIFSNGTLLFVFLNYSQVLVGGYPGHRKNFTSYLDAIRYLKCRDEFIKESYNKVSNDSILYRTCKGSARF